MKKSLASALVLLGVLSYSDKGLAFISKSNNGSQNPVVSSYGVTNMQYHNPIFIGPSDFKINGNVRDSLIKAGYEEENVKKLTPIGNTIQGKDFDRIALICRKASILGSEKCEYYGIPKSNKDLALVKPAENEGEVEEFQGVAIENPDLSVTYDRENKYIIVIKKSVDE